MSIGVLFGAALIFALARGFLRYAEQACNHFIAFKLLALIRDKVFGALSGFVLDSLRGPVRDHPIWPGRKKNG